MNGVAAVVVTLCAASRALAGETVWVNAAGGAWSNPANWSNGVPSAADSVVLPQLDRDGYVITLGGARTCAALRVSGSDVTLENGLLQAGTELAIGTVGDVGGLRLNGCTASALAVRVGTGSGIGTVAVAAGSVLGGVSLDIADGASGGGVGSCSLESGGFATFAHITLGSGSTLHIETAPLRPAPVTSSQLSIGGTLEVSLAEGWTAPAPASDLLLAGSPVTGQFGTVVLPVANGVPLALASNPWGISLLPFDPLVSVAITSPNPIYVGFEHALSVSATRLSGSVIDVTAQCDFDVSDGAEYVELIGESTMVPLTESSFTLLATIAFQGQVMQEDVTLAATDGYPRVFSRADVNEDGEAGNQSAAFDWAGGQPTMSSDGRFIAFSSYATNLVAPAPTLKRHVYVKDRVAGAVERIDVGNVAGFGDLAASDPAMSADGRFVAFLRRVPGPSPLDTVWVRDRWKQETWLASADLDGNLNDAHCGDVCIAADGSAIYFSTGSHHLVKGVEPEQAQIFRHDLATRTTTLVSRAADGSPANGACSDPCCSFDGSAVAFSTVATNLVACGNQKILVWDASDNSFDVASIGSSGCANGGSAWPSISSDGSRVAFASSATNLGGTSASGWKVYLRDRLTDATTWVDVSALAFDDPASGFWPVLSGDGGTLAATRVGLASTRLLRVNLSTGEVTAVPIGPWADEIALEPGFVAHGRPWLSNDGSIISFAWMGKGLLPFPVGTDLAVVVYRFDGFAAEDINHDGFVNGGDLASLLGAWGSTDSAADLDGDGVVGSGDMAILLAGWSA